MNTDSKVSSFYEDGAFQDFYKCLEVNRNANSQEIQKSYHRLSKIYHPDSKQGDVKKMQQLGTAYRILKNEQTRKLYDSYYLNQEKESNRCQSQSVYGDNQSKQTFSNIDYSSSCFSWQYIRTLLRKCHYSDILIENFISWCQKNSLSISSGSELCSRFKEYNSIYEANQIQRTYHKEYKDEHANVAYSSNLKSPSVIDFMFYRQMIVRQIVVASLFDSYFENLRSFYPQICNLQIYAIPPVGMVLYSYVPTSKVVFCSRPKVKYYF